MARRHDLNFEGKVALVTGGSRGIGRATVELFADLGARVALNYVRDAGAANEVCESIRSRAGEVLALKGDVADAGEAGQLVKAVIERFGRLDILVCNAGIWEGAAVEEMTEQLWDRTIEINLKGTWAVCHAAVPFMKQQKSGKIVVVSSTAGQRGEAGYSNYAASKGGQISFVKSLAEELGPFKINVNAVAPGWVDTDMTTDALGNNRRREIIAEGIPLRAIATPDEIAAPIAFLCSDWASHITGEVLNVNGGSVLCG
jgi:3-oxoacyl-[acyl-carrier protein] reductase